MQLEMKSVTSQLKVNRTGLALQTRVLTATRNWTFKYWRAKVPLILSIKNIKLRKQNSMLSYLRLSKWPKNSVKVRTNLGTPANTLSGEFPAVSMLQQPLMYLNSVIHERGAVKSFRTVLMQ